MDQYRIQFQDALPTIAIQFFGAFARFEFALKRGGFLKGQIGEKAEPNWDAFARALGAGSFQQIRDDPQAEVFFTEPPRRLVIVEPDVADFIDSEAIDSMAKLFVAIRRVRNNLFHGDKCSFTERDDTLVKASLFVLDSAFAAAEHIDACARVPHAYVFAGVSNH